MAEYYHFTLFILLVEKISDYSHSKNRVGSKTAAFTEVHLSACTCGRADSQQANGWSRTVVDGDESAKHTEAGKREIMSWGSGSQGQLVAQGQGQRE